jgi:hypothetical protein
MRLPSCYCTRAVPLGSSSAVEWQLAVGIEAPIATKGTLQEEVRTLLDSQGVVVPWGGWHSCFLISDEVERKDHLSERQRMR